MMFFLQCHLPVQLVLFSHRASFSNRGRELLPETQMLRLQIQPVVPAKVCSSSNEAAEGMN